MKFNALKEDLLKTTQTVQNAISAKSSLPILSNILIEADKNNIRFTATDLDMGIISLLSIKPEIQGAITMPGKKFLDIIKELPDKSNVSITAKKNNMIVIECGKAFFKIIGLPKDEFPQTPQFKENESITLEQKFLKEMLVMTAFAVSRDETRYVLNGVLFIIKDDVIKLVATDGRRLAVIERRLPQKTSKERRVIAPATTIQELSKILKDEDSVKVSFSENQVLFDMGKTRVISRLIEGEYPNYEQVIPKEVKDKVKLSRETFLSAAKRANIFTNQDSIAIKMDISKNKMVISKNTPYIGEAKEELNIDYKGKDISIGFNPVYLMDVLKNVSIDEIGLELSEPDRPGVIRIGEEYVYVVLPMQPA